MPVKATVKQAQATLHPKYNPAAPRTLAAAFKLFIRQPSPRLLIICTVALLLGRLYLGNYGWADVIWLSVIVAYWPFQEWLVHRYILHMRPLNFLKKNLRPVQANNHQLHHEDPWRLDVLFIYKGAIKYAVPAIVLLFWLITRDWAVTLTCSCTYLLVVLRYEWTHYLTHTPYQPRSQWYQKRYLNHRRHHFNETYQAFGVTSLLLDKLFLGKQKPQPSNRSPD